MEIPDSVDGAGMIVQAGIQAIESPRRRHVVLTRQVFFSEAAEDLNGSRDPFLLQMVLRDVAQLLCLPVTRFFGLTRFA